MSRKFLKYCLVGTSGVGVNLGTLFVLATVVGVHANVSSALAIELSILSNFLWNDVWTFREQRRARPLPARLIRFHLVTLVGAGIQWTVFVLGNAAVSTFLLSGTAAAHASLSLTDIVLSPPNVGAWKYVSQLFGIALATCWNFFANAMWTWKLRASAEASETSSRDEGKRSR